MKRVMSLAIPEEWSDHSGAMGRLGNGESWALMNLLRYRHAEEISRRRSGMAYFKFVTAG